MLHKNLISVDFLYQLPDKILLLSSCNHVESCYSAVLCCYPGNTSWGFIGQEPLARLRQWGRRGRLCRKQRERCHSRCRDHPGPKGWSGKFWENMVKGNNKIINLYTPLRILSQSRETWKQFEQVAWCLKQWLENNIIHIVCWSGYMMYLFWLLQVVLEKILNQHTLHSFIE